MATPIDDTTTDYPAGKAFASIAGFTLLLLLAAWLFAPWLSTTTQTWSRLDLSDATFVEIRTLEGDVVMSGELRSRVDQLGGVEKDAALLGPGYERVIGEIEIEIPHPASSNPRQELEVDVISLKPRTPYQVIVNDRSVAGFTTDDRGSVDVEFH
jgi:hypothetical protein